MRLSRAVEKPEIANRADLHQVDLAVKQVFQSEQQPEVPVGRSLPPFVLKFDQEVNVAG